MFLIILYGCGSQKVITTKYYVIEIDQDRISSVVNAVVSTIDKPCEIEDVEINPAYASTQIANRSGEKELTYYAYHQWAIRPAESFTRIMLDYFIHVPVFSNASPRFWKVDPVYRIETRIYHLEVIQKDNNFIAHLELEFALRETANNRIVVRHHADELKMLEQKDINLLATSFGNIFFSELNRFSGKIIREIGNVQ